jgi:pyrroline-5-carboxylate reductase
MDSTKPQVAKTILTEEGTQKALENKLIISILAGVTIDQIKEWVPSSTRVIRAMPNTPCMVIMLKFYFIFFFNLLANDK